MVQNRLLKLIFAGLLFITLSAAFFSSAARSGPEPKSIYAAMDFTIEDGRVVWSFNFLEPRAAGWNFPRPAYESEFPFTFSRSLPHQAVWTSQQKLRLELPFSRQELVQYLFQEDLVLTQKADYRDLNGELVQLYAYPKVELGRNGRPSRISVGFDAATRELLAPLELHGPYSGKLLTYKLRVAPPRVDSNIQAGDGRVSLVLNFSHPMVEAGEIGRTIGQDEAPFIIEPPLPLRGRWTSGRRLEMEAAFSRDDFVRQVVGASFDFKWRGKAKALSGQPLPPPERIQGSSDSRLAPSFTLIPLKLLDAGQVGVAENGRVRFDLDFNKMVSREGLQAALSVGRASPATGQRPGPWPVAGETEVEVLSVERAEWPAVSRAAVLIKAGPWDTLELRLSGLKAAEGEGPGCIKAQVVQTWVTDYFHRLKDGQPYPILTEKAFPWRPFCFFRLSPPWSGPASSQPPKIDFNTLRGSIASEPPVDFELVPYGREGDGFLFLPSVRGPLKLILKPGLRTLDGSLSKTTEFPLVPVELRSSSHFRQTVFIDRPRQARPAGPMPVMLAGPLYFRPNLEFWRIYDNNLPALAALSEPGRDMLPDLKLAERRSDLDRDFSAQAGPDGFSSPLGLNPILQDERGAFVIKASRRVKMAANLRQISEEETRPKETAYMLLVVSDLSLSAQFRPGWLQLWAASGDRPLEGAEVSVYDRANQLLAQGRSSPEGLFEAALPAGAAALAVVRKGRDINYLNLRPAEAKASPAEARPTFPERAGRGGENAAGEATAADLNWFGRENSQVPGPDGFPGPALEAVGPALAQPFGAAVFLPRQVFSPGDELAATVLIRSAVYQPVSGLRAFWRKLTAAPRPEAGVSLAWKIIDPRGWVTAEGRSRTDSFGSLNLKAELPIVSRPGLYRLVLGLSGQSGALAESAFTVAGPGASASPAAYENDTEEDLRPEGFEFSRPQEPQPRLGLRFKGRPVVGRPLEIEAAALGPDKRPLAGTRLRVEISRLVKRRYNAMNRGGSDYKKAEELMRPVYSSELELDSAGRGRLLFSPMMALEHQVKIVVPDSGAAFVRPFSALGPEELPPLPLHKLDFTFDRPVYRPGQSPEVTVTAPFSGFLRLSAFGPGLPFTRVVALEEGRATVSLPAEVMGGGGVRLSALALAAPREASPLIERAYGLAFLPLDHNPEPLTVTVEAPEILAPSASVGLRVAVADGQGRPVTGRITIALAPAEEGARAGRPLIKMVFPGGLSPVPDFYDSFGPHPRPEPVPEPELAGEFPDLIRKGFPAAWPLAGFDIDGSGIFQLETPAWAGPARLTVLIFSADGQGEWSGLVELGGLPARSSEAAERPAPPRPALPPGSPEEPAAEVMGLTAAALLETVPDKLETVVARGWLGLAVLENPGLPDRDWPEPAEGGRELRRAVQGLVMLQSRDGSFLDRLSGRTDEWLTLHAIHFLMEARGKTELPEGLLSRALDWMSEYMYRSYSFAAADTPAYLTGVSYGCYILAALNGEYLRRHISSTGPHSDLLPPSGLIFIGAAASLAEGDSRMLAIMDRVPSDRGTASLLVWPIDNGRFQVRFLEGDRLEMDLGPGKKNGSQASHESEIRNLAFKLLAWTKVEPQARITASLARRLVEKGLKEGWGSPHEQGVVVMALGRYRAKMGQGAARTGEEL